MKQQSVGTPGEQCVWENSALRIVSQLQPHDASRDEMLTKVLNHVASDLEFSQRNLAVPREQQNVPVLVAHPDESESDAELCRDDGTRMGEVCIESGSVVDIGNGMPSTRSNAIAYKCRWCPCRTCSRLPV